VLMSESGRFGVRVEQLPFLHSSFFSIDSDDVTADDVTALYLRLIIRLINTEVR